MIKNNWLLVGLLLTTSCGAATEGLKEIQKAINTYNTSKSDQEKQTALEKLKTLTAKPANYLDQTQLDTIAKIKKDHLNEKVSKKKNDIKKTYRQVFIDLGIPLNTIPPIE